MVVDAKVGGERDQTLCWQGLSPVFIVRNYSDWCAKSILMQVPRPTTINAVRAEYQGHVSFTDLLKSANERRDHQRTRLLI
jgi:hypothetical protein